MVIPNRRSILFAICVTSILSIAGCVNPLSKDDDTQVGMKINDLYYFQYYFAIDLEIKQGNNVTFETVSISQCDEEPFIGCIDSIQDGQTFVFDVPADASPSDGVWFDDRSFDSSVFHFFETKDLTTGVIFTEQGIAFSLSTQYNFNETKADDVNLSDVNNDGNLQMCFIGLDKELSSHHALFVDQGTDNQTEEEAMNLIIQRYDSYLNLFEEKGVLDVYNHYCEADFYLGSFALDF